MLKLQHVPFANLENCEDPLVTWWSQDLDLLLRVHSE